MKIRKHNNTTLVNGASEGDGTVKFLLMGGLQSGTDVWGLAYGPDITNPLQLGPDIKPTKGRLSWTKSFYECPTAYKEPTYFIPYNDHNLPCYDKIMPVEKLSFATTEREAYELYLEQIEETLTYYRNLYDTVQQHVTKIIADKIKAENNET